MGRTRTIKKQKRATIILESYQYDVLMREAKKLGLNFSSYARTILYKEAGKLERGQVEIPFEDK